MVANTPLKKAKQDMPEPDQPKMPEYEYQKDDSRSFSVGYGEPPKRDGKIADHSENKSALKIF